MMMQEFFEALGMEIDDAHDWSLRTKWGTTFLVLGLIAGFNLGKEKNFGNLIVVDPPAINASVPTNFLPTRTPTRRP